MVNGLNSFHNIQRSWNIDMRVGNHNTLHTNAANTGIENMFGAQCKVTISREGRKLSEQMEVAKPKHFAAAGTEKLLLRQQKRDELNQREQSSMRSEISNLMNEIRSSYAAGEDKETIANKQDALNHLLDLKTRQEEENEQRIKDAENSAVGAAKEQEEINRKNADLYLLLKSLEEQEKDEEEDTGGSGAEGDTAETEDAQSSVGDPFRESSSMLGASAAKRELQAVGMIDAMFDDGYGKLAQADAMMHDAQVELDLAADAMKKETLSKDEKNQLMSDHMERAYNIMQSNYGEMMNLRRSGHQMIQDAKELKLKHIEINPLDGVDRAKQAIMDAGADAALREASQNTLDKASEALEERVQEEIDQRDDVVSDSEEKEEEKQAEEAQKLEEKELEQEETAQELLQFTPTPVFTTL